MTFIFWFRQLYTQIPDAGLIFLNYCRMRRTVPNLPPHSLDFFSTAKWERQKSTTANLSDPCTPDCMKKMI
ncbi:hypothetical protein HNY73_006321 [Argiope bruennichi]|uniref:Uncharacterized protein n=1 Tax=Argiope bruennichi TaxID=94029 RepID=A0A8T0FRW8_ARGBR|nr:hypothetical protein HNY73_006321 [Argiope bruennichi]